MFLTFNSESTFYCDLCNKSFSNSSTLKSHFSLHDEQFLFKSPQQNFLNQNSMKTQLKPHFNINKGEKLFKCSICQKGFSINWDLKMHLKFHSSEKPFKCSSCSKAYKTKAHLKEHFDIKHKGIKKFICDICQHLFTKASSLKVHLSNHNGEKKFKCLIASCDKFFNEKGNMMTHYKRHLRKIERTKKKIHFKTIKAEENPNLTTDGDSRHFTYEETDSLLEGTQFEERIKFINCNKLCQCCVGWEWLHIDDIPTIDIEENKSFTIKNEKEKIEEAYNSLYASIAEN